MTEFQDAYIERLDKETEELLAEEDNGFLNQPIAYFQQHKNEFMYLESAAFTELGVDGLSFEVDDVFGTYEMLLGLRLQKKYQAAIKDYLHSTLQGDEAQFSLMFNGDDGLWDLNFGLNHVEGFKDELTIKEAYKLVYAYLKHLVKTVKS
ncbi:branched-chain amino acid aminotransferase [Bacillus sp. DNRA2]|uniref:branched-chain amino acid aminotransferase n=1 Tax=Bacillus sp. DNRA2 TaxID=2723053 RepID=UPI00145C4D6D|nr:branched-chain amino acid aminotransferase [Bacillus sp. DNRA2]NMD69218.1 branched-chain amino acid aminotransferase [Bacillus sp. DNRA2]